MVELIDYVSKVKMLAMIMARVEYHNDKYLIYCIDRGKGEANIFVSKLILNSEGFILKNDFDNGEKKVLDNLVKRIINKEDITEDGFIIDNKIELAGINYFNVNDCYVTTVNKNLIKEVMLFYHLISDKILERPVVEVVEDKKIFNEGFVGSIFLIVFGFCVIIFSIIVIVGVFK